MKRADKMRPPEANEALAVSYLTLLMKREIDGFARIWQEDAVSAIPFRPEGVGKFLTDEFMGKDQIMEHYLVAFKNRSDHVFWIHEVHRTADPAVVIIEAHAGSLVVGHA